MYVGWLTSGMTAPLHHAWVVIDSKYLVDISDDLDCFLWNLLQNKIDTSQLSHEETRELYLSFSETSLQQKNSNRCHLGKVSYRNIYIGSPCSLSEGIAIFNQLIRRFPEHPCLVKGTDEFGRTPLQKDILKK